MGLDARCSRQSQFDGSWELTAVDHAAGRIDQEEHLIVTHRIDPRDADVTCSRGSGDNEAFPGAARESAHMIRFRADELNGCARLAL
jgi:hypothetical protein